METKTKQNKNYLFTNMFTYAALQIINLLIGLVLPRLYLSVYGSEINGAVSTVNSFITYFSFIEAGLGLTLIHALFKPLADKDNSKLNNILSFAKRQYVKISAIYFGLVVILSLFFPMLREVKGMSYIEFSSLIMVIGLFGALDFYTMAKYRVLLTADRREYIISNAMIIAQLLRFIFEWILLSQHLDIVFVKLVPIVTLIIRSIILKVYIDKNYSSVKFSSLEKVPVNISNDRWDALLLQISISTSMSLPTIIVSQFIGFKEANVYAIYSLVISAVIAIISALSSGVAPILGRSIAQGKEIDYAYDLYEYVVTFVITLIFAVTVVMMIPFIQLYTSVVSDVNYINTSYAILFSIWGAIFVYRIPLTAVINAAGIYRQNRENNLLNISLQAILGCVGTYFFGIEGLLVVVIIMSLHRNIVFAIVNDKVILQNKSIKSIIRQLFIIINIFTSYHIFSQIIDFEGWNPFLWIKYGFIVFLCELFLCSIFYSIVDNISTKNVMMLIKRRI